MGHEWMLVDC